MSRYTVKTLKQDVETINESLAFGGSAYSFEVSERNGYTAIDLIKIDVHGEYNCERNIEAGTPRECITRAYSEQRNYSNELDYKQNKATRLQAYGVLYAHIDFSGAYHTLNSFEVEGLVLWAKKCKYRKPVNAPHSTAHAFFISLGKLENKLKGKMRLGKAGVRR